MVPFPAVHLLNRPVPLYAADSPGGRRQWDGWYDD